MLQSFHSFFQVYINNIIVFSQTLKKHIQYLSLIFSLLIWNFINLFFKKFYLNYSSIALLSQCVNILKLSTLKEKWTVITQLYFSTTLKQLETYLNLIN